jgi:hypothetical protein
MVIVGIVTGIGNKVSGYQELLDGASGTNIRVIRNGQGAYYIDYFTQLALVQPLNFLNLRSYNLSNSKAFPITRRNKGSGEAWKLKPIQGFRFPRKETFLDYP